MSTVVTIEARWDPEAQVWTATSPELPGLVVKAETWPALIEEVRLVCPELMECDQQHRDTVSLRFRVSRPYALSQLLEGATPATMREAFAWGDDVGREVVD
jgi:hypothetical protein